MSWVRKFCILGIFVCFACLAEQGHERNEVRSICENAGTNVVFLNFRDGKSNIEIIRNGLRRTGQLSNYLADVYSKDAIADSSKLLSIADIGNRKYISESFLKQISLKFSTESQKKADPDGYRAAVKDAFNKYVPREDSNLGWFLNLKGSKNVSGIYFGPADKNRIDVVYGAETKCSSWKNSKREIDLVFANNESEPIPYLISLIAHELQHAKQCISPSKFAENSNEAWEQNLINEAPAFNVQLKVYIAMARKNPEIFCNWLYVSWSYGNLVIPMSWMMATLERDLENGKELFLYAKMGRLKDKSFLLNKAQTDLREDLKKRITDLKLRYVK
jgi:hypothetical protein